jgi:Polyketide cyclase / dehydrase and lipid transport
MRGSVRREVVIGVGADAAWRVVGRPDLLHHWFPGIVDCRVDGDARTVTLATGLTFDETILTNDPLQRRFQYRIAGGLLTEHLATLDVIGLAEDACLVTYATDAAPATMAIVLGGAMAGALEELRRQLEAGAGPALTTVPREDG